MQTLRVAALAIVLGLGPGIAHAEAMDEPRSGLHLDVPGACQVKPAGDAACAGFEASAHQAERFAVVLHDGGLLSYSIAMFADPEPGADEERAQRVVKSLGAMESSVVSYNGQSFLRAELHPANGAALCFVTVDDRPEVAIIMFASDPTQADAMRTHADEAMHTIHRTGPLAHRSPRRLKAFLWAVLIPLLLLGRFLRRHFARRRRPRS